MTYTAKQIENAKRAYTAMLQYRTVESYNPQYIGYDEAQRRCEYDNNIVKEILNGNKELEKKWKLFFLMEEVKADQKASESKAKLSANKEASASVLSFIKDNGKKLGDYYKWLNTPKNIYRKEYFSKKYTMESATQFINL